MAFSGYSQKWEKNYDFVDNCVCGLSKVQKNGKIGYVNKDGVEIIKPQYEDGLTYQDGYAAVKTGTKWLYLDSTGKAITEAVFEDASSFSNGLAAISKNIDDSKKIQNACAWTVILICHFVNHLQLYFSFVALNLTID